MGLKIIISMGLIVGLTLFIDSFIKRAPSSSNTIDTAWWNSLSEEWKTILLINQNFQRQQVDIFKIRHQYINRLNAAGENDYDEMNTCLHDLDEKNRFGLSYTDFYARAIRTGHLTENSNIDLSTLATLETIYMVNGPCDLTPLKKFPRLKVLIINYCGVDNNTTNTNQVLDLGPLAQLKNLRVLQCSSNTLVSLAPLKDITSLEELYCNNSGVTTLAPLKKLINLKILSVGSGVTDAGLIAKLNNLEELYISGCKKMPDFSKLKKLRKLCIAENEMAIVNDRFRINSIGFLKDLVKLEFLDLNYTSYKGSLDPLYALQNLKAITLPPVTSSVMLAFKNIHKECVILNAFQFER